MSYVLASLDVTPPGGWAFDDPVIPGDVIVADSFEELLERAVHRRALNGARTAGVEYEIMDHIAARMTTAQRTSFTVPRHRLTRGLKQRLRAMAALINPHYVSLEKAAERAAVCLNCPMRTENTNPVTGAEDKVAIAKVRDDRSEDLVDGELVPREAELFNCGVCTCPNQASVHFDVEQAVVGYDSAMWEQTPDECWKKTELQGLLPGSPEAEAAKRALRGCTTCRKR